MGLAKLRELRMVGVKRWVVLAFLVPVSCITSPCVFSGVFSHMRLCELVGLVFEAWLQVA